MHAKIVIVSPSKDCRIDIQKYSAESQGIEHQKLAALGINVGIELVADNKENLTKVLNRKLEEVRKLNNEAMPEEKIDFFIFIHHDVELDMQHFLQHLSSVKEKYDLIGLCGTEVLDVSQSPLNWFTGSRGTPKSRWGQVIHGELGNAVSFFSSDRETIEDHAVACIDGLCICFGPKALESDLKFDERLSFNCYDTQISLEALMNKKLRVGVIVERSLYHYSIGQSIMKPEFLNDEQVLRTIFNI